MKTELGIPRLRGAGVLYALLVTIGLLVIGCPQEIEPVQYTITFDSHGGTAVEPIRAEEGTPVDRPADPKKEGFVFQGWFDAEAMGTQYPWPHELNANITMHAQWLSLTTAIIGEVLAPKAGVWYSHYGKKRLDGYTIGQWKNIKTLLGTEKRELFGRLFPDFDLDKPRFKALAKTNPKAPETGEPLVDDEDYFIFYDDTVYGEGEDGSSEGEGGWGFSYMGIVRAVNTFDDTKNKGAFIIEYLDGCYPQWSNTIIDTPLPFFGIYYRVLDADTIQIANSIVLENLYEGLPYHTETVTLEEAIAKNNAENAGEFVSWGVIIPQEREGKTSNE
jgi:uncharacterized repeat protein (TIGR02543 family)